MEIILLEKIHNLGTLGDKVKVKAGYGRNYLIPRQKAVPATPENIAKFEARRAELEAQQQAILADAQTRAAGLTDLEVVITAKPAMKAAFTARSARWKSPKPSPAWAIPLKSAKCACPTARCGRSAATPWNSACTPK